MARELRIEIDDVLYEQLEREAHERHEDPAVYAGRFLAHQLDRARFLEGAQAFAEEHGQAFADRFGTGSSSHAA
ncbi:hypothetical protein [Streptomyces sp. NPDC059786]|uniref:hypothetical protein n=1 Tax=Streptomyces sp. NPDC059786 TaxID=3346946 RepID=UPI0036598857